ncbi:MAG: sigma-54 dependent transcriptional regulator [Prevotellaceae bacterium]|jgi:DNA-binding NtrC family response regulator|nr:sigma-54 dependent transcriptional regulator [Prevotellaceae bacterium]
MSLKNTRVLIVDDDKDVLTAVSLLLKPKVKEVHTSYTPETLRSVLSERKFDLLLLDMNFSGAVNTGNEGLFWLRTVREIDPELAVVMITAYGEIDLAVRSLKEGASDFIVKPWRNERLITTLEEIVSNKTDKKENSSGYAPSDIGMIGESTPMRELFHKISKVAPTDANILILGENGTGKELIATAIHKRSLRANKPFVKVDVGALTDTLFESELFGHKKGAFTDARENRIGLIEAANGGTLFLDEIGNITLPQQAKLLSVLQNRCIIRLGTNTPIPVDIRLVTATNVSLADLSDEQRFRKDLIYRINTVELTVPPLRERDTDIELLANHFARLYTDKYLKPNMRLSKDAINKLNDYRFPGNVRELQYAIERAVIMDEDKTITADDIIFSPIEQQNKKSGSSTRDLKDLEQQAIEEALERHKGNISKAAKELGITRTALYRRIEKYGL